MAGMHAAYEGILADLVEACRRHYGGRLTAVAVYGSVGRGTPRFDSDVDLLIVAAGLPEGRFARVDEFHAVEEALAPVLRRRTRPVSIRSSRRSSRPPRSWRAGRRYCST